MTTLTETIRRYETQEKRLEEKSRTRILELERNLEQADERASADEALISDLNRRIEDACEGTFWVLVCFSITVILLKCLQ